MMRNVVRVVVLAILMTTVMMGGAMAQVAVPNLAGQTRTAASATLTGVGLVLGTSTYGSSANYPVGQVYRQNPVTGTSVASGTAVNVVIAKTPSPAKSDPVWPWGSNPGTGADVNSFCEAQQALMDNSTIMNLIPAEYTGFLALLAPDTGDVNGTSYVIIKSPYPDGDPAFQLTGNGKIDCKIELRLIGDVLGSTSFNIAAHDSYTGLTHAKVLRAINVDYEQYEQDVGTYWGLLGSAANGLQQILLGHMVMGGGDATFSDYHLEDGEQVPNRIDCTGSGGFIQAAMFLLGSAGVIANPAPDMADYIQLPEFFAMDGDADGDGAKNSCEYQYANDTDYFPSLTDEQKVEKYVEYALDATKRPPLDTEFGDYCNQIKTLKVASQSSDRWLEVGNTLSLGVTFTNINGAITYSWAKDGTPISGANSASYSLDSVTLDDSGVYTCTATDQGDKTVATASMIVKVVPVGTLPVAAPIALGALVSMLLAGGGLAVRRKRN